MSEELKRHCGGMADTTDLKSVDRKVVWVQVPPVPQLRTIYHMAMSERVDE
tara:strand:- start:326 stop:478 length:153 start_codon:yes stop_codon:yes gene_type:complete